MGGDPVPGPFTEAVKENEKWKREFEARHSGGQRLFYLKLMNRVANHRSLIVYEE